MNPWDLSAMDAVGGHETEIIGRPKRIDTDAGMAVEFDGAGDALVVDSNPLAGLQRFTAELIFRPYPGGLTEQRFFHIQENDSESRLLFETRLTDNDEWILDAFIKVGERGYVLFDDAASHAIGPWYHVAIVVGDGLFGSYTNGELELETEIDFVEQGRGKTSLGVRMNRVCWYKGALITARFSPRPLAPAEFLGVREPWSRLLDPE